MPPEKQSQSKASYNRYPAIGGLELRSRVSSLVVDALAAEALRRLPRVAP